MTDRFCDDQSKAGKETPRDLVPLIIGAAIFMQALDAPILTTILPAMAQSLQVSPIELKHAITVYYIGAAAFLPISGWCADAFGARRVFQTAIVAFAVCSLLCGLAQSPIELAAIRAVMGAATAGLLPVGRLLLIRTADRTELVRQLARLTIPATIGPLIGPVIGGAFATYGSWRWTFLINVPIGVLGFVLVSRFVPDIKEVTKTKFDALGALLAGVGLSAGVYVIERMGRPGALAPFEIGLALLMAACAIGYAMHARRTVKPILDFALVRISTFRAGVVGGFFFRLSQGCQSFLLALLFQIGFGMTAFASGGLVMFSAAGSLLVRWFTPKIVRWFGFKHLLVGNGVMCIVLGVAPILLTRATPFLIVATLLFARGFFQALQITALNVVSYVDVREDSMSSASSLAATAQQLTQALSIALAAGIIATAAGEGGVITSRAISASFAGVAVMGLVAIAFFGSLARDAGADVSGQARD